MIPVQSHDCMRDEIVRPSYHRLDDDAWRFSSLGTDLDPAPRGSAGGSLDEECVICDHRVVRTYLHSTFTCTHTLIYIHTT